MPFWQHSRGARLLIIDDNPSIHRDFDLVLLDGVRNPELESEEQRLYGGEGPRTLVKPSYALEHALSGLEGLERISQALGREEPFQVAFVDIRMPGIDGVETIERIWQLDARIQTVICTAFADYSWDDLVRRLGYTDKLLVLKKPFDNIEVMQLASTLSEKWFLARQAALKFEQMELLVAQRTERLLALQRQDTGSLPRVIRPAGGASPGEPAEADKEPPLVLLVSGNAGWRRTVGQALRPEYRLAEAEQLQSAWQQAQEAVPDLVLGELGPTYREALELCRRMRSAELTSHIPVMLVPSERLEENQTEALEAGADDCVAWSSGIHMLKRRVENLLQSRGKLLEKLDPEFSLHPRELALNQVDATFLRRTVDVIEKHLPDYEFDVDALAQHLAVSRRQLFRKLRAVVGCTPNMLIRNLRLKRAAQLLQESHLTVTEITYAVGFADLKYFRTLFKERFGVLPGDYTRKSLAERVG